MRGLKGKRVAVTGASSGIGLGVAKRFYEEGAHLLLVDVVPNDELAAMFPERMDFLQADISSEGGVQACDAFFSQAGIDVLINNAGITRDARLAKMTVAEWDAVIAVNLTAIFRLSQIAARLMEAKGGVILNAASVVAHYGNFGQANYAATKAGVIGMTKTLAKELGRYGIRVNAVAPGFVETPMVAKIPEKIQAMMKDKPPLKRMGNVDEIAAAYAFLASSEASYITGETLNVDGGLVLG